MALHHFAHTMLQALHVKMPTTLYDILEVNSDASANYRTPLSVVLQVSTEGDAFTMAFHDPIDAISWALDVQHKLLLLPWPQELLSHADAKEQYTPAFLPKQILLFKGLRVRMAMHTGKPDAIQVSSAYAAVLFCAVLCCDFL